jgi:SAM-dependent methyltransferase
VRGARPDAETLEVMWHDLENGSYAEDLGLWRELAAAHGGPVLDVGAGTGRVTLDLARHGHTVVALDRKPELLAALRERAAALPVATVVADARAFELGRRFPLIVVPMQTVQLLGGPEPRGRFLACARAHLEAGGVLAVALAEALDAFDQEHDQPPLPDLREVDEVVFSSRPVAVIDEGEYVAIHRIRETVDIDGNRTAADDVVRLDRVSAAMLAEEAEAHGLAAERARFIPQTDDYVGSTVVMLHG